MIYYCLLFRLLSLHLQLNWNWTLTVQRKHNCWPLSIFWYYSCQKFNFPAIPFKNWRCRSLRARKLFSKFVDGWWACFLKVVEIAVSFIDQLFCSENKSFYIIKSDEWEYFNIIEGCAWTQLSNLKIVRDLTLCSCRNLFE